MKIIEFRVLIPMSLEKFQVAKRYINLKYIKDINGNREGIELIRNEEPFENEKEKGYLTEKIYHIKSKIPSFIRWAVPEKLLHFHEISYNAFPHTTTVNTIDSMGDRFILSVESLHLDAQYRHNDQTNENEFILPQNALNLNDSELKDRKIVYIDILNGPHSKNEDSYTNDSNPSNTADDNKIGSYVCPEIGLKNPLSSYDSSKKYAPDRVPEWAKKYDGPMTLIVKVVRFQLKWWGLQTAVENMVANTFYPKLFTDVHQKIILSSSQWKSLTCDDIKKEEEKVKDEQKSKEMFND